MGKDDFFNEIIRALISGKVKQRNLEKQKSILSKKYRLFEIPKNAQIMEWAEKQSFGRKEMSVLSRVLQTKPVRSGSGVSVIAVMAMGECPGKCIYCPRGENSPQSYTGVEPATMRARRANYDPILQVRNRLRQLEITGHHAEKCELIIMGGTFPSYPVKTQEKFAKGCYDALNKRKSPSLIAAQNLNEKSKHRCIGLTIETRPDYCGKMHIKEMLRLGTTRVELGVQSTDDRILKIIRRGHSVKETITATKMLKDSGLKVCYHMMPGLSGLDGRIDIEYEKNMFDEIFSNPDFMPDLLKVYPVLIIPGTKLYRLWKKGLYSPMSIHEAAEVLMHVKQVVPKWVRIQRMQRDISSKKIAAGPILTNIRQHVLEEMAKKGLKCNCIRCREVGHQENRRARAKLIVQKYYASDGREIFLSFEDTKRDILIGYLRLRLPSSPFIKDLKDCALVRELHVYGQELPLGARERREWQHKGYGKLLMKSAEDFSEKQGFGKVAVTSGIGARQYYRKLGYRLKGFYMIKSLK